jgi:1-acyl-sn-glycerol-3-phosphate acyltransferase
MFAALERTLRSAVAAGVVAADTITAGPIVIAAATVLGPTHPVLSQLYREYARVALLGFGASVRSTGEKGLNPRRRYVFVSNHQSHLDALAILVSLPRHGVRFVAKRELGDVPIFGQALRATGNVFVERSGTQRDVAALDAAQRELLKHISVLFFAEGTRSESGELGEFKRGAAAFALKAQLEVVPLGVAGSYDILPRGLEVKRGGTIGVAFGKPIPTKGRSLEARDMLTLELREAVAAQIERARDLVDDA